MELDVESVMSTLVVVVFTNNKIYLNSIIAMLPYLKII